MPLQYLLLPEAQVAAVPLLGALVEVVLQEALEEGHQNAAVAAVVSANHSE